MLFPLLNLSTSAGRKILVRLVFGIVIFAGFGWMSRSEVTSALETGEISINSKYKATVTYSLREDPSAFQAALARKRKTVKLFAFGTVVLFLLALDIGISLKGRRD